MKTYGGAPSDINHLALSHPRIREVGLTAYILALNKIIGENDVMNAETLPKVKMPNRDGFISKYPDKY